MTDRVNISGGADNVPEATALSFLRGAGEYVANGVTLIAGDYSSLAAGPYGGFGHIGTSGLDVTIDTGEASVGGAIAARDTTTTVTLNANSTQSVYVGWPPRNTHTVKIGLPGSFQTGTPMMKLWTFTTDGSSWTSKTDERPLGIENAVSEMFVTKGGSGGDVARVGANETISGQWQFNAKTTVNAPVVLNTDSQKDGADVYVQGSNAVDGSTVVVDGDGDDGQDDDVFKARGGTDPSSLTNSDTVLVVKGDDRVGVGTYSPSTGHVLDVDGATNLGGHLDVNSVKITGQLELVRGSNSMKVKDPGTDSFWYLDQNGDEFRIFYQDANGNFSDHFNIKPNSNTLVYSGAIHEENGNPVVASGDGVDRDEYISSSEPSGWEDGDKWYKPK